MDAANARLNRGYDYRETLGPAADGLRLLDYLSLRYRHATAAEWAARIAAGRVLLDAQPAQADSLLRRGGELVWRREPWVEPEAPRTFTVLYEDEDLLAVDKPAGLPTLPGADFLEATLLYRLRACTPDAAPLHRLGRWTSGLVLCARTHQARAALTGQWSTRAVVKRYRALAGGDPARDGFTVETPIGPVPHAVLGTVHAAAPQGRPSRSDVTVLERRADAFLCDVHIATGRPHQIRIHLAAAGHPLLGDPLYAAGGLPAPGSRALPGDPGYHLHSAELRFRHPRDGRPMVIACAPPPLLRRAGEA
ncbi:MAG: RluA family pseudouridine synthase [Gammaproteobacteria bacterium]|nr:RluA family pseudouridine synthase [Gammaproteobacteria bacterium]